MKILTGLFIFLFFTVNLFANSAIDGCHKSTEGTNFWFGFMEGRDLKGNHFLEINVTARETTAFSVFYGPKGTLLIDTLVQPGISVKIRIPKILEPIGSENIEDKGIHLVSEKPVNVFALNWDEDSNDAAVIYPVESLGTEYFAMCYTPSTQGMNGKNSEFVVVATEDFTVINITPTVETDRHKPKGVPFSITLNKGQLYQVQSMNDNYPRQGDLTGTYISSNKPVALLSGSLIAVIPPDVKIKTGDHLFEQVPPLHAWGREFYTVQYKWRNFDRFRVLASKDNTVVTVDTYPNDTLNRGEFKDYVLRSDRPGIILADKPIMVAQYSQSNDADYDPYPGATLEPFMTILSPVKQMRNSANFVVYQFQQRLFSYFIIVITTASQESNMRLDGKPINFQNTGGSKYSFATIEFEEGGVHYIWNTDSTQGFLAYEYSYGENESYGYGVAFNLDPLLDLGENLDFGGDTLLLCYGTEKILDAGRYFQKYEWNTGDTTQKITISKGGEYSLTVTDKNGCTQSDTVFVLLSHPVTELGIDTASCAPFSLPLDAGTGFKEYLWSTGETTQKIIANKTFLYSVTVTDKYGCKATDSMRLKVKPIPEIELISPSLICSDRTTKMQLKITGTDPAIWAGHTHWSSDNLGLKLSDPTDTSVIVTATERGDYKIFFHLSTTEDCDTIKEFDLHFYDTPVSKFDLSDGNEQCGSYSRDVLFTGSASPDAIFNWDIGSSQIVDTIGYQHYRVSLGIGSNAEIKLVIDDHGCLSDTFRMPLLAFPNFEVSVDSSRGCNSLNASFKAQLEVGEKVDYFWKFGDGGTSTDQNPTHRYTGIDFYDVELKVKNQLNGCEAAFLFKDMIKVFPTPVANFSADPNVCYNDTINIIYLNNKDSSNCTWTFQDAHQLGQGNDSIRVIIDLPVAYIRLQVEEFGCLSVPETKTIKRKPHFDFTTDVTEGCQPLTVNTVGINKDGDISGLVYYWMLGRQKIAQDYTHRYFFPDTGRYDLGLEVYSQLTQCRDTIKKPGLVWVHPKPVAQFGVNFPVAYIDNPEISFTNQSVGASRYVWDFGDGNFSWAENPKHEYGRVGIYNPQLIAISESFCLDTTNLLVNIIPFNVFVPNAFRPDSDIPENKYFMPVGPGIDPERFNIKFFDRWGQLIFESLNMSDKWDGKTRNGQPAPMGNYVWIADYYDLLGNIHHLKGQVLLIR